MPPSDQVFKPSSPLNPLPALCTIQMPCALLAWAHSRIGNAAFPVSETELLVNSIKSDHLAHLPIRQISHNMFVYFNDCLCCIANESINLWRAKQATGCFAIVLPISPHSESSWITTIFFFVLLAPVCDLIFLSAHMTPGLFVSFLHVLMLIRLISILAAAWDPVGAQCFALFWPTSHFHHGTGTALPADCA